MKTRKLLIKPNITTRGFIMVNENEELIKEIESIAEDAINSSLKTKDGITDIKTNIINSLNDFTYEKTGRKPIILPVIVDINK